ncbi:MAG TPA: hypothetical protein VJV04_14005 [Nitrospiraceae bacterium]|nr:hypothetical protein [Nitrospiraceae bacterium]
MAGSFVLSRVSRCSVAQGYASLDPLHAALLNGHFEHPAGPEARGLEQKIVKATRGRYTGIRLFLEEAYVLAGVNKIVWVGHPFFMQLVLGLCVCSACTFARIN